MRLSSAQVTKIKQLLDYHFHLGYYVTDEFRKMTIEDFVEDLLTEVIPPCSINTLPTQNAPQNAKD